MPQDCQMLEEIEFIPYTKIGQLIIQMKKKIIKELEDSKKLFKKNNWPIIDVTRKSVEESAASIIKILDILHSR